MVFYELDGPFKASVLGSKPRRLTSFSSLALSCAVFVMKHPFPPNSHDDRPRRLSISRGLSEETLFPIHDISTEAMSDSSA